MLIELARREGFEDGVLGAGIGGEEKRRERKKNQHGAKLDGEKVRDVEGDGDINYYIGVDTLERRMVIH